MRRPRSITVQRVKFSASAIVSHVAPWARMRLIWLSWASVQVSFFGIGASTGGVIGTGGVLAKMT